jgi:hypothetical protein
MNVNNLEGCYPTPLTWESASDTQPPSTILPGLGSQGDTLSSFPITVFPVAAVPNVLNAMGDQGLRESHEVSTGRRGMTTLRRHQDTHRTIKAWHFLPM